MLIMSYDRKTIIKAKRLEVSKNFGGKKDEKWVISAWANEFTTVTAAVFPDEKMAVDALEKAFRAFEDGTKCYRFD